MLIIVRNLVGASGCGFGCNYSVGKSQSGCKGTKKS